GGLLAITTSLNLFCCWSTGILPTCRLLPLTTALATTLFYIVFSRTPHTSSSHPMKAAWQLANLGQALTKRQFPGVFRKAWVRVAKLENAVHVFLKCGIFTFDPKNIDMTKLDPSKAIIREVDGEIESSPAQVTAQVTQNDETVKPASTGEIEKENQDRHTQEKSETEMNTEPIMEIGYKERRDGGKESLRQTKDKRRTSLRHEIKSTKHHETALPKSLSVKEALKILNEREDKKKNDEEAKKQRQLLRTEMRKQKLEEKDKKKALREEAKKKREEERSLKAALKEAKQKRRESSSESLESDMNETPRLADTDDDIDEERSCTGCGSDEGDIDK
ncbi:hypothetical protein DPMN_011313, partial [Dreissena polymorpha]